MNSNHYHSIVIGSGPGGEGAAMKLTKSGQRVAIVERHDQVGGGCTHWGTIPSKALRHSIQMLVDYRNNPLFAHTLDQVFALGQKKAHERVCFLLKQLSDRAAKPGLRSLELVMTRQDIADYLVLTIETVSRAFGKLKREGVIDIYSAHTVEILDMPAVEEMALAD